MATQNNFLAEGRRDMISRIKWVAVLCGFTLASMQASSADAAECTELKRLELPRTQITFAGVVQAGAFSPPAGANDSANAATEYARLPSFCRVTGTVRPTADSDIRFEVWMPAAGWNGKFVGVGNGAWAGSILHAAMIDPLSKGYATAATDGGHQGDPLDASFAAGHAEKLIDFGYRATHEMTVAAKATIAAFYGRGANRSLFASCSTGGRQGLMEAYRYPEDYDAISAMAPANPVVGLMVSSLWIGSATSKNAESRISPAKFGLVQKAAVKACDADDGLEDGLISEPRRCRFDPAVLQCKNSDAPDCLTAPQIAAMHAIYDGPRNPRTGESIFPGFERGSEALLPIQASGTGPFPAVASYFRDLLFNHPNWDFRTFDYDKDVARALTAHSDVLDVPAKGLERYLASGRKLLLSHGWSDPLVPPMVSVNFYDELGATKAKSARLFMIPGMGHCAGGDGPFVFDPIATIDKWAETGDAPEHIVVSNPPNAPARTRRLCAFPSVAIQSGNADDEKSFHCEARQTHSPPRARR